MPLGIMPGLQLNKAESLELEPGDLFVIMTDGIFEAHRGDESFGVRRVCEFLLENRELSAVKLVTRLDEILSEYTNRTAQADDMTVVVIKRIAA